MEYKVKTLSGILSVTGIVNLHFFEFSGDFSTKSEHHPFAELVFVNTGSLVISSDEYTGELKKGEMILHTPGETHALRCPSDVTPTVIIIGFTCEGTDLTSLSKAPVKLSDGEINKLAEVVKEGRNVFKPPYNRPTYDMKKKKNQPRGSEQLLKILLEYFFIELLRKKRAEDGEFAPKRYVFDASEIIKYVDENFLEKITIDELAFLFGTNRSTLCKSFKALTGQGIGEYANARKLEFARKEIVSTDKTFTEIAEEMKFESIHYFSRFFKTHTGLSPREYRTAGRQGGGLFRETKAGQETD